MKNGAQEYKPDLSKPFTCVSEQFGKAPQKRQLFGNKKRQKESAQHIIEFPGGAIELSRTSDGNYWAHIIVNNDWAMLDCEGYRHSLGEIIDGRIDRRGVMQSVSQIPKLKAVSQVALLIKPIGGQIDAPKKKARSS